MDRGWRDELRDFSQPKQPPAPPAGAILSAPPAGAAVGSAPWFIASQLRAFGFPTLAAVLDPPTYNPFWRGIDSTKQLDEWKRLGPADRALIGWATTIAGDAAIKKARDQIALSPEAQAALAAQIEKLKAFIAAKVTAAGGTAAGVVGPPWMTTQEQAKQVQAQLDTSSSLGPVGWVLVGLVAARLIGGAR